MKLSICTPCKGRLKNLKESLPKMLKLASKEVNDFEIVVLDWDCPDEAAKWVLAEYPVEISSKVIKVGKVYNQKYFEMAHSKNVAHLLSTGDILINNDTDHIWNPGWLARVMEVMASKVYYCVSQSHPAIYRDIFEYLGGYNEMFDYGWGIDDMDFNERVRMVVPDRLLKWYKRNEKISAIDTIKHKRKERSRFTRLNHEVSKDINAVIRAWHADANEPVANHGKVWGYAVVEVNGLEITQTGKIADRSAKLPACIF